MAAGTRNTCVVVHYNDSRSSYICTFLCTRVVILHNREAGRLRFPPKGKCTQCSDDGTL